MECARNEGDELIEDYVDCLMSLDANARPGESVQHDLLDPSPQSLNADTLVLGQHVLKEPLPVLVDRKEEPYLGMEFESDESAKIFYNEYARRLGFPFRVGRSRRSKGVQEILIMKRFVCSKEGIYRKKPAIEGTRKRERLSMREGCKAMMEVIKDTDRWVISKLETMHNHHLGTGNKVGYLRARGLMDKATVLASDSKISPRQNFGEGDAQGLLDYCRKMQAEDPAFFYAIHVDNNSLMSNTFWADTKARNSYSYFGDVVSLDTTYKKNKYMMPFITFSGVSHHLRSIIFGCAVLFDESEFSFIWLFETWLAAMGGCPPTSLVTDQNRAISAAIAKVFPNTCHRLCKWLILSRSKQKLAHIYSEHPSLRVELENCVIFSETIRSFETCWVSILDKYDLKKNTWLQGLFNIRQRWVPAYLKDTFFAELSPSQRLETMNEFYKRYFNTRTPLRIFLTQFDLSTESQYEEETEADSAMHLPNLKTASPIEKKAAEMYTKPVFEKFQEEFVESLGYNVYRIEDGPICKYNVTRDDNVFESFIVTCSVAEKTANCSCKHFEFSGILCRHVLGVFLVGDVHMLPEVYLLKRWTRNAKSSFVLGDCVNGLQGYEDSITLRYRDNCCKAIKFAERGALSIGTYKAAKDALQKALDEIVIAGKSVDREVHRHIININEEITPEQEMTDQSLHDPDRKVTNLLGHLLASSWSPL